MRQSPVERGGGGSLGSELDYRASSQSDSESDRDYRASSQSDSESDRVDYRASSQSDSESDREAWREEVCWAQERAELAEQAAESFELRAVAAEARLAGGLKISHLLPILLPLPIQIDLVESIHCQYKYI